MCLAINDAELSVDRLIVSRKLDLIIVEYMCLKNKYRDKI